MDSSVGRIDDNFFKLKFCTNLPSVQWINNLGRTSEKENKPCKLSPLAPDVVVPSLSAVFEAPCKWTVRLAMAFSTTTAKEVGKASETKSAVALPIAGVEL